ncbi:MAG TPA: EAL domain-containing protein [Jatrophihabitans sp.]|nr:EAL domain-containing protein [Jatrophihabitans sp.]
MSSTARWAMLLAAGVAAIAGYYQLPQAGVGQAVVLSSVNAIPVAASVLAARRARGLSRSAWISLAVGMLFSTLGDIVYIGYPVVAGRDLPLPSPVDALWLMTYPCYVVALWAMARQRRGDDYHGNLLDGLIISLGGATVLWTAVLGPALDSSDLGFLAHAVSLAYPSMDVAVFAMLVRLLVGVQRNPAMQLIAASFISLVAADTLNAVQLTTHGSYQSGSPCDGLWMLSYLLIGVAALHPTARAFPTLGRPVNYRMTRGRVCFLTAALLVGPIAIATRTDDRALLTSLSVLCFLLVMTRMVWLNRRLITAHLDVEGATDELRRQATHDALTGLPNRMLILDRIERLQAWNRRTGTHGAVLFLDLDGFKNVNDTIGHDVGDKLLQAVAARLTESLREVDTIGRLGGDEFIIALDGAAPGPAPQLVAQRVLDLIRQPFEIAGVTRPLLVTTSIGIAAVAGETPSDLLRNADVALYQAKANGKNCFEVFHPEMQAAIHRRYQLELDLRGALETHQYRLMYQPIYDLENFALLGFEALLRWDHPTHGVVSPTEFIPILESSAQIVEVGRWVLREACRQMAAWSVADEVLTMSVNVSAAQLDQDSIVHDVREALQSAGLDARALTVEITETALMHNVEATAARLRELKKLGVRVAIDDFGTGYSSLAYLQQFPVDCLKIDRAFTDAIARSPENDALIHTLVQLGKLLGLKTLAEGVETPEQVRRLRTEHVDAIQGFLLSRPIAAATVEQRLLNIPR